jgi:hypothetical protein
MPLRVYLSGPNPQGEGATALAVSYPRSPAYARYPTPDRYQQVFGPSAAQVSMVSNWLTSEGVTITATNQHYITVTSTVALVDAALDTQITAYANTSPTTGKTITYAYADVGVSRCPRYGATTSPPSPFSSSGRSSPRAIAALPTADAPCPVPRPRPAQTSQTRARPIMTPRPGTRHAIPKLHQTTISPRDAGPVKRLR